MARSFGSVRVKCNQPSVITITHSIVYSDYVIQISCQHRHFQKSRKYIIVQGRIQDFKLGGGGGHLKKLRRAEGGAKIVGVFRVKIHDFTPKNHIFSNFFLGGGGGAGCAPPLLCIQT